MRYFFFTKLLTFRVRRAIFSDDKVCIMKKKILFVLIPIFIIIMALMSGCTIVDENKRPDAYNIAINQFGFDKVYTADSGTRVSVLLKEHVVRYCIYVIGERDGEEVFIVVPAMKYQEPYEIDWPFKTSFKDIVKKYNEIVGEEEYTEDNYELIEFEDSNFDYYGIDTNSLDVAFGVWFGKNLLGQINGEIVMII